MGEKIGPEDHATLRENVLHSIRQDELRRAKRYLFVWGTVMFVSLLGAALSLWYLFAALSRSGFYEYLSLLLTDLDVVLLNSREFFVTLAGSVPLLAVIASLATVFAFLFSLRACARHARGSFAWA